MPVPVDLTQFGNPWEHVRLLSDAARNEAMLKMLQRRAPGARVLEVGCGTGLLSCVAARLGARKVYAVEPTPMAEQAQAMVEANGLQDVVEVICNTVEEAVPREVDVAFSELLNADPFIEGVLPAMAAAREWLADGGACFPRRLSVWAAGIREADSAREVRQARAEVRAMAERYGLVLDGLDALMAAPGPYSYVQHVGQLATRPVCVWELEVGVDADPEASVDIELVAEEPGPVGGVALWFECELDDGILMHNRPGEEDGHWGQLVCAWPEEVGLGVGKRLRVRIEVDEEGTVAHRV